MDDLISRQAAIDAINDYFARIGNLKRRGLNKGEKAISLDMVEAIETLPPAQERKKGKWIRIDEYPNDVSVKCSECGVTLEDWMMGAFYNYCPNCGAEMRGEEG